MTATVTTTMFSDVQATSSVSPEILAQETGPCTINVELSPPPIIEVGVKQSITAEEVITAFSASSTSVGFAGPLVTKTIFKNNIDKFVVPLDIYGDLVLNMVMATVQVAEEDFVTELLIDIIYDKESYELLIPDSDLAYLGALGELTSITISYIQKVSK
jgi:hypothetical protein